MPQTVPMGFEFETLRLDEPARTLNGGSAGLSPLLAQQVNDAFVDLLADIADLTSRVTAAEAALADIRWRHISQGQASGGNFSVPVPAGYEMLHLHLWGDLDANGQVQLRINGDTTSGLHRQGYVVQDTVTPPNDDESNLIDDTSWFLANWGAVEGNTVDVTVFETAAGNHVSFQAYGGRQSANATSHRRTHSHGKTTANRVVSSFEIVANQPIAVIKWWLDGRLAPS